jgi:hypothetical protein
MGIPGPTTTPVGVASASGTITQKLSPMIVVTFKRFLPPPYAEGVRARRSSSGHRFATRTPANPRSRPRSTAGRRNGVRPQRASPGRALMLGTDVRDWSALPNRRQRPRLGWQAPLDHPPRLAWESSSRRLFLSPRRTTALEPAAGCRSGGRPRFLLVAHPRSARRAGRVSSRVFGCSSWRVASARCNAGRRAAVPVPSRCEDSEALAKHPQERGAELAVPRPPARFLEN